MPCYDAQAAQENADNREKVHKLTDMLCRLCTQIENDYNHIELPLDISNWWRQHKLADNARMKRN